MKKLRYILMCASIFSITFFGCSKDDDESSNGTGSGGAGNSTTSCSTISAQNTITHNAVTYKINALSGANNSIGIEVVNMTGPFAPSYSMVMLQVSIGSSCYESTSSTEGLPGLGKFFEFQNMPAWSISTSTTAKVRIELDGSTYYIQDLNLDQ